jgi:hypothetical protein
LLLEPEFSYGLLVLTPRFSLDEEGKYAISHAPFLYPKDEGAESDILKFFLAVLNSTACYWYIATHSHVYQRGYAMLEVKTLKKTRVPNPFQAPSKTFRKILKLVDERLLASGETSLHIEKQLDSMIADLYDLSAEERLAIGIEN